MELKPWTYEEMPDYTDVPDGANVIETSGDEAGTVYLPNVVYAQTPEGDLKLQILLPNSRNASPIIGTPMTANPDGTFPEGFFDANPAYPCVLHVQGSAWFPQNLYGKVGSLSKLAERGFVVALVEYRDSLRAKYPTPILDTLNAVRFMRKHARQYCVDPDRIVISGDSSGGHTAMMAGIWCKEDKGQNLYPDYSSAVSGIISQYASGDFTFDDCNPSTDTHCTAQSPEGMEMGGVDMTPEQCRELTIRTHIHPETDLPPVLLFHGTKDRTVNTKCSVYLYETLKACGKDVDFYLIKGADHGGSEFWTPQVIDIMEAFIRRVTSAQ